MKNIALTIWIVLAIGGLLFGIIFFLAPNVLDPFDVWAMLLVIGLVFAAAITFLFLREHRVGAARFLFVVWMGVIAGTGLSLILLFWGVTKHINESLLWTSLIIGLAGFLVVVILSRRKPLLALVLAIVVALGTFLTVQSVSMKQSEYVKTTVELWKSKGWSTEVKEVFPKADTTEKCKPWFTAMNVEKTKDLEEFYREQVGGLSKDVAIALETGERIDTVLSESKITEHPQWEILETVNIEAVQAMEGCPYVQYFDPLKYEDNLYDAPIPNLLHTIRWSRGATIQALVLAQEGKVDEATTLLHNMVAGADRFQIQGQILINSLIAIAVEKMAAFGFAGVQAITGKPLPAEDMEKILTYSKPDPVWAKTIFDSERYTLCKALKNIQADQWGFFVEDDMMLPRSTALWRAWFAPYTEKNLDLATEMTEWYYNVPNFETGDYAWHEAHVKMTQLSHGEFTPYYVSSYARILSMANHWRLVMAANQVLETYKKKRRLPDSAEEFGEEWPGDPYAADQPLKYKKMDKKGFIVYSLGPDEEDQMGEDLYVFGILEVEAPKDHGFHITLK